MERQLGSIVYNLPEIQFLEERGDSRQELNKNVKT